MEKSKPPASAPDLLSRAIPMAGLVDVAPGAVVSRTVIGKKSGTVTLFAFDRGQGLSTHSAPYDAMVWILEGSAEITIAGKELAARAGDMVIMPAHLPHGLHAAQPFKMALVMIKEQPAAAPPRPRTAASGCGRDRNRKPAAPRKRP